MNNFKQNKRGGFYFVDQKPYVSVTQILSVIDKPALRYWFGREVFRALLVDPTLDEQKALAAPYNASEKAKNRGSMVHSIIEAWKASQMTIPIVDAESQGYVNAFYKWTEFTKPNLLEQEKTVFSHEHGYAGTLDALIELNGKVFVLDFKTGKAIYPESWLQTSAYLQALRENNIQVDGIAVVLLKENGDYQFEHSENYEGKLKAFLAAKTLWEGLNEELLTKIGI